MAQNDIALMGAVYPNVPAVTLPIDGGGTALFTDTSDADAVAGEIASGKKAYVNGVLIIGSIVDGNQLNYGLTDGTLPLVGVAKVGSAVI